MHRLRQTLAGALVLLACLTPAWAETYTARDTLGQLFDEQPAAVRLLEQIEWEPQAFDVTVTPAAWTGDGDAVVRFDSPRPSGNRRMDTVPLLWFKARDETGEPMDEPAPAVLLVHTLHPRLVISKTLARAFSRQGLHAFIMQMPGFGERSRPGTADIVVLVEHASQAVADARRARDAVVSLPQVADGPVALQATSLGGFIASVAASLDGAFDPVLLAMTGGDAWDVLQNGRIDAAHARNQLARHGYTGQALRDQLDLIEPLHVAHRMSPTRTWLFSGRQDQVIPPTSSDALARAIGLDDDQHRRLNVNHYSAIFQLPRLVREMTEIIRETER